MAVVTRVWTASPRITAAEMTVRRRDRSVFQARSDRRSNHQMARRPAVRFLE
jgi:hypothetical protein